MVLESSEMKVIFVASGNKSIGSVSAFVQSQFNSLKDKGLNMILFPVVGHGIISHLRAGRDLRRLVLKERPDIVHAHYSICGYVATLSTLFLRPKVVVSILGSFPNRNWKRRIVRFFIKHIWDITLVKSHRTADQLELNLPVIPNGVNLAQFHLMNHVEARESCQFTDGKKYIIWCSHPSRTEKRFSLAQDAVVLLNDDNVTLYPVYDHPHADVVRYMCAADALLLTSVSEGSPNVIKEAMACNCPIISTDVGDVRWVTEGVEGTYVADHDTPESISRCIQEALCFNKRTQGRDAIVRKGLSTECIADRIIELYSKVLTFTD